MKMFMDYKHTLVLELSHFTSRKGGSQLTE